MPVISLTTFVDYATGSGTTRIATVRRAKEQYEVDYNPAFDFYKQLREAIEATVKEGWTSQALRVRLRNVHSSKKEIYEDCRKGFTKWVGRKEPQSLPPVTDSWEVAGLEVRVNPELHVRLKDEPLAIKLHFKSDPLSKRKLGVVLHLLRTVVPSGSDVAVLDVRRGKLFRPTVEVPNIDDLLVSEALALRELWRRL